MAVLAGGDEELVVPGRAAHGVAVRDLLAVLVVAPEPDGPPPAQRTADTAQRPERAAVRLTPLLGVAARHLRQTHDLDPRQHQAMRAGLPGVPVGGEQQPHPTHAGVGAVGHLEVQGVSAVDHRVGRGTQPGPRTGLVQPPQVVELGVQPDLVLGLMVAHGLLQPPADSGRGRGRWGGRQEALAP